MKDIKTALEQNPKAAGEITAKDLKAHVLAIL
jgi:hypothetical protein